MVNNEIVNTKICEKLKCAILCGYERYGTRHGNNTLCFWCFHSYSFPSPNQRTALFTFWMSRSCCRLNKRGCLMRLFIELIRIINGVYQTCAIYIYFVYLLFDYSVNCLSSLICVCIGVLNWMQQVLRKLGASYLCQVQVAILVGRVRDVHCAFFCGLHCIRLW